MSEKVSFLMLPIRSLGESQAYISFFSSPDNVYSESLQGDPHLVTSLDKSWIALTWLTRYCSRPGMREGGWKKEVRVVPTQRTPSVEFVRSNEPHLSVN